MTIINPAAIAPLPAIPDSSVDQPTFDIQWQNFNTAIGGAFRTGTNNAASASYENALDAAGSASAANTSAGIATTQAGLAVTQVGLATTQANNAAASAVSAVNAPGTSGTSATSLTVSAGTQTFTTQTGKAWVVGQPVSIARTSAPGTTCMYGTVTAYDSGTGSMSALVGTGFIGAGTFTDWTIGLSGTGLPLKTIGGVSLLGVGDIPVASSQIGDVFTGTQVPSVGTWLPLNSAIYLQSSYATLYAQLGLLADRSNISGVYSTVSPSSVGAVNTMAFGAGLFVAVTNGSATAYSSPDGVTWTARTMPSSQAWQRVIFANGIFLAVAFSTAVAASSTDGITWTARTLPSAALWSSVAFGAGLFVAASTSTAWATSSDGISWTARTGLGGVFGRDGLLFGNGTFLGLSGSGTAYTSTDGINWTNRTMPLADSLSCTTFGGGLFVTHSPTSYSIQVTADGINWRVSYLPIVVNGGGYQFMLFAAGFYVIPGNNSTAGYISSDGVNWRQNQHATVGSFAPTAGAYNAGRIVMCQNSSTNNNFARSSLFLTYNTATQFAVPEVAPTPAGTKQWIRAL